jgi:hypothetical protein
MKVSIEEYRRTTPNIIAIIFVGVIPAIYAPNMAPIVVAISRNIPILILEKPSLT